MEPPVHRYYLHFQQLPMSLRVLYTAALLVLGMGYLFAAINIFATHSGRDGNPASLSVRDIEIAYSGTQQGSKLEAALLGPMSRMLPLKELDTIVDWVREEASKDRYQSTIKPIIEERCLACHDGSNPLLPNLDGYENLSKMTEMDTGADIFTLVRVSHIHLFGMTFIFFIVGLIFSHAYIRPVWFKCAVVVAPFVGIAVDVSSWYFTKLIPQFAWMVLVSGAVLALSFTFMWITSLYQIWVYSVPPGVVERQAAPERPIG